MTLTPTLQLLNDTSTSVQSQINMLTLDVAVGQLYTVGTATLAGSGTATVANTKIKATDTIIYNRTTLGGTPGHLSYAINAGTSIVFTSSSTTDTSTIAYVIIPLVANLVVPATSGASIATEVSKVQSVPKRF